MSNQLHLTGFKYQSASSSLHIFSWLTYQPFNSWVFNYILPNETSLYPVDRGDDLCVHMTGDTPLFLSTCSCQNWLIQIYRGVGWQICSALPTDSNCYKGQRNSIEIIRFDENVNHMCCCLPPGSLRAVVYPSHCRLWSYFSFENSLCITINCCELKYISDQQCRYVATYMCKHFKKRVSAMPSCTGTPCLHGAWLASPCTGIQDGGSHTRKFAHQILTVLASNIIYKFIQREGKNRTFACFANRTAPAHYLTVT